MAQNRKPPAYQEYAATLLANRQFKMMTLAERGLLFSLRLECWENKEIPANHKQLAKYLGCNVEEIQESFSENVSYFFKVKDDLLHCPELEDYRKHIEEQRQGRSNGGKKGAAVTNSRLKANRNHDAGVSTTGSQAPRRVGRDSLVKLSSVKKSQKQLLVNKDNEWVNDYDKASNGE